MVKRREEASLACETRGWKLPKIKNGSVGVGVGVDVAGGNLSSTTIDHNAFAEFVFRDTVPRSTEIKDLKNCMSTELN
jgi:hypothetical protein